MWATHHWLLLYSDKPGAFQSALADQLNYLWVIVSFLAWTLKKSLAQMAEIHLFGQVILFLIGPGRCRCWTRNQSLPLLLIIQMHLAPLVVGGQLNSLTPQQTELPQNTKFILLLGLKPIFVLAKALNLATLCCWGPARGLSLCVPSVSAWVNIPC